MNFSVEISNDIYPKRIVSEAKMAFKDYALFEVSLKDSGTICLKIVPLEKYAGDEREIVLSFLNYMLDLSANYHLKKEQ